METCSGHDFPEERDLGFSSHYLVISHIAALLSHSRLCQSRESPDSGTRSLLRQLHSNSS